MKKLDIHTTLYKPLGGSSFIDLPGKLKKSRSILNIKNLDNKCFLWAVLGHLHQIERNPEKPEHYYEYEKELNMKGIPFPVTLSKTNQFERQNVTISINVFGFEGGDIFPLRITKHKGSPQHVNLLYLQSNDCSHFCLIRDLNAFLFRTKTK